MNSSSSSAQQSRSIHYFFNLRLPQLKINKQIEIMQAQLANTQNKMQKLIIQIKQYLLNLQLQRQRADQLVEQSRSIQQCSSACDKQEIQNHEQNNYFSIEGFNVDGQLQNNFIQFENTDYFNELVQQKEETKQIILINTQKQQESSPQSGQTAKFNQLPNHKNIISQEQLNQVIIQFQYRFALFKAQFGYHQKNVGQIQSYIERKIRLLQSKLKFTKNQKQLGKINQLIRKQRAFCVEQLKHIKQINQYVIKYCLRTQLRVKRIGNNQHQMMCLNEQLKECLQKMCFAWNCLNNQSFMTYQSIYQKIEEQLRKYS